MATATLSLGKKITLIVGGAVYTQNCGNFESIISKFDNIIFTGLSKPNKKNKYQSMLENKGFTSTVVFSENAGFEGANSDVINFRIEFSK